MDAIAFIESYKQIFDNVSYEKRQFPAYAFILPKHADSELFLSLTGYYEEIHEVTGEILLLFLPRPILIGFSPWPQTDWPEMNGGQRARYLKFLFYESKRAKETGSVPPLVEDRDGEIVLMPFDDFLLKQVIYARGLMEISGLKLKKLPCVLIYSSLEDAKEFVYWPISEDMKPNQIIEVLESVAIIAYEAQGEGKDVLRAISAAKRWRVMSRNLSTAAGKVSWAGEKALSIAFETWWKIWIEKQYGIV